MRQVLQVLALSLLLIGLYYVYHRTPVVRDYYLCYDRAYQVYDEKGMIIRRANLGDAAICLERKAIILQGLECMTVIDQENPMGLKERQRLQTLARSMLWGPKDITQMVKEHNQKCTALKTMIKFDPRLKVWF
ncbi:hypothetical protein A2W24_03335 [Microgenomates group bacterium RBG_16_45_19]|nr:MAG: hypothetical protein A2W24_03335 [Microgenomates group bacterium RBG_16_45_19]